ncbi:MAG: hypothetical protein ACD_76C00151G0008 [uncultured bacterium]|nr:MAG: hypothetical protein ACD_76C00151G0008 [uncultured bacterium]
MQTPRDRNAQKAYPAPPPIVSYTRKRKDELSFTAALFSFTNNIDKKIYIL